MKIYTKTGDKGRTGLFGGGRVAKSHARLEAYGTLDELNANLGLFAALTSQDDLRLLTHGVQSRLFDLGAHLATPRSAVKAQKALPALREDQVAELEKAIDRLEMELPALTGFILPGGTPEAAVLQVARAVCRRAERAVVRISGPRAQIHPVILPYLNRLSDLLFVMARVMTHRHGAPEILWKADRVD
jgi:cob(I)alamin adenosyltransferase